MVAPEDAPYDDPVLEAERLRLVTEQWFAMKASWDAALAEAERELRERTGDVTPWWRELLVWKDATADADPVVDLMGSMESLPRHDATAARAVVKRVGEGLYSVPDMSRRSRFFRVWNGMVWGEDSGEIRVWSWMDAFWDAYRRALMHLKLAIDGAAEDAAAAKKSSGAAEADQDKTRASTLKAWNDKLKKHHAFFDRLGNQDGRNACAALLAHVPERCRRDMEFDAVPEFTVLRNGVLDLGVWARAGGAGGLGGIDALLPHSSVRAVTLAAAGVDFAPEAGIGGVFLGYLETALPDVGVRWHLQKALGAALLGRPRDKMMLNLIGPPDSGKSVLLEVLDDVLGDYSRWVAADTFLSQGRGGAGRSGDGPSPALHSARRSKLVLCSEPDPDRAWDAGRLKSLTGRDKQTTRGLHENLVEWVPRFLLIVASNQFVRLDVADTALVQRIHPIEFPRRFRLPGVEVVEGDGSLVADPDLTGRILESEAERSGVLNWLLGGLVGYLGEGLVAPAEIGAGRAEMVLELSPVRQWLEEMLTGEVLARDVVGGLQMDCIGCEEAWDMYRVWHAQMGESERMLGSRLNFIRKIGDAGMTNPAERKRRNTVYRGRPNERVFDRLWPGVAWTGERGFGV